MAWIRTIAFEDAKGVLKKLYNRVKGPENKIDNVLKIHSLRPHTLHGHMVLYKSVLHHAGNTFPKWYLEFLGTYVSALNACDYCFEHHSQGILKNLEDKSQFDTLINAIEKREVGDVLDEKMKAGCQYAEQLTVNHTSITEQTIEDLKEHGFDDGEILEINQLVCYFNYVNRMVVGLGVDTKGDIIGLSPNDNADENNWSHS
ncbi:MAG: hypothetical protein P1U56_25265 [Saprospiraceae bacterium]|nr:hypothetical protein [Saprospiraceae bacterium]